MGEPEGRPPVDHHLYKTPGRTVDPDRSLIQGAGSRSLEWEKFIQTRGYAVKLADEPGRGKLSSGEIAKLTEVSERYRNRDHWELSDLTHDFPEWKRHWPEGATGGSYPIPREDVIAVQGKDEQTIRVVEDEEAARNYMDELFGSET